MKKHIHFTTALLLITTQAMSGQPNIHTLYTRIDPKSVSQNLAFYELYPNTTEGQKSLKQAWSLLSGGKKIQATGSVSVPSNAIQALVDLVNKHPNAETPILSDTELTSIEKLADHLHNRRLKGHTTKTLNDLYHLTPDEIDLARGLFLSQLGESPEARQKMRSYEAMIDLMALQILAKLPDDPSTSQKIAVINSFIFDEMGFRFPPHSLYAKDIDVYTFLPSVLDSRQGVCLGVSILYLSLAQRLQLPLEAVTPPGHIYVRCREGNKITNIETTARGIHIDSEEYLGIDTRKLQLRTIKEVIGLAHMNEASTYWKDQKYQRALDCYEKAVPFLPDDRLIEELAAWNYLFTGQEEKAIVFLKKLNNHIPDHAISGGTIIEDFLTGNVDQEGIKAIFLPVDETRDSILSKKTAIEDTLKKFPKFKEGWLSLGVTWLQLHRTKEALIALSHYHTLHQKDPSAEYYLAALSTQRLQYDKAWHHLINAEKLTAERDHHPKALKQFRRQLEAIYPE